MTNKQKFPVDGIYCRYVKRLLDIVCAVLTLLVFWWLLLVVAIIVRAHFGAPVIFKQPRPGKIDRKTGQEKIFYLYKFRTMTNERDENGELLPDVQRLTHFGKLLRATSLDELPEVWNILRGDMSVIGPRPQLVRDMVFMSKEHRTRHVVRPGLSGLAQISGRNALAWDNKFKVDLEYIRHIGFIYDVKIVLRTVASVLKRSSKADEIDICADYGDYLLEKHLIDRDYYDEKQLEAKKILEGVKSGK